jgi:mannose-6-phosphate isomerase-like protein (cupin superfamily)
MAKPGDVITNPRTGQRMRFLKTSQDTGGELLQIECFNTVSRVKEPEHIHPFQENRFEMISGSLVFCIAGKERQLNAGEVVAIPLNVPHFFWNGSDQEAHYIQEFRSALRSELFFETLFGLARDGKLTEQGLPDLFDMAVFVPCFWNEIRVTRPPEVIQKVLFTLLGPVSRLLGHRGVLP